MPLVIPLFWCAELTGEAIRHRFTAKVSPQIDFSTVNGARFRTWNAAGTVRYLSATIAAGATSATCTVVHTLDPASFTSAELGKWACSAELSFDGGSTWAYAGTPDQINVVTDAEYAKGLL